jgi:hypothetical protein
MKNKVHKSGKLKFLLSILLYGIAMGVGFTGVSGCNQPTASVNRLKIQIKEEGIYQISADMLSSAGMDIEGIDPRRLQLSLRGAEQSLYIFRSDDTFKIEFFGQESQSKYSAENIYILDVLEQVSEFTEIVNTEALEIPQSDINGNSSYIETQHIEENALYFPQVDGPEHWFWIAATNGQRQTFLFVMSELAPGEGLFRLDLWSNTEAPVDPDHHLLLKINDQPIIDETWDGKGEQLLTAAIPEGVLVDGENIVLLDIPGDTQAAAEVSWINWLEVSYPRRTIAQADHIRFTANDQLYTLSGFQGVVQLFDITDGNKTELQYVSDNLTSDLVFTGMAGHTYYAVGEDGLREPVSLAPLVVVPDLKAASIGADYLAIGPEEFLSPTEELLAHREAQGLKVMQVPLQAIYDQFNHGFPEPEAISRFLIETTRIWETAPQYILLIGDASYDPQNYLQQPVTNILPSYFVQTQYGGQTASDIPFADLTEDGIPDIAVGRVPATTAEEVAIFVRKTMAYENHTSQQGIDFRLLAVADGQEAGFRIDAQRFLDIFEPEYDYELFAPEAGTIDANNTIHEYFNQGYSFIAYFGHGSVVMWGKDRLFSVEDATNLTNPNYPILINMTCLTGLFTHPKTESLSEAFLFNPSGGAVAVLAPTSLTLPGEQSFLSTPMGESLSAGTYERLGDSFLSAQRQMAVDSPGVRDVLETFLLFGDPGLVISPTK